MPGLQEAHDPFLVCAECRHIAAFTPSVAELPGRVGRVGVDAYGLLISREEHEVGVTHDTSLQPVREAGVPPYEILHQAARRGAERIVVADAVDHGGFRDAGAADPPAAPEQRYVMTGALQTVGRNGSVDAGADDRYFSIVSSNGITSLLLMEACQIADKLTCTVNLGTELLSTRHR